MSPIDELYIGLTIIFAVAIWALFGWWLQSRKTRHLEDQIHILEMWVNSQWADESPEMPASNNIGHKSHG